MTAGLIVEAGMQHASQAMLADPMFDSLRAWSRESLLEVDLPIEWTLTAMHEAGVELGLLCAWVGTGWTDNRQRRGSRDCRPLSGPVHRGSSCQFSTDPWKQCENYAAV